MKNAGIMITSRLAKESAITVTATCGGAQTTSARPVTELRKEVLLLLIPPPPAIPSPLTKARATTLTMTEISIGTWNCANTKIVTSHASTSAITVTAPTGMALMSAMPVT